MRGTGETHVFNGEREGLVDDELDLRNVETTSGDIWKDKVPGQCPSATLHRELGAKKRDAPVATRMLTLPVLKSFKLCVRLSWDMSPLMHPTSYPLRCKNSNNLVASFLYSANTNALSRSLPSPAPFFLAALSEKPLSRKWASNSVSFCRPSSTTMATCSTRELAVNESEPTVMRSGAVMKSAARRRTDVGQVAENMAV